jgi:uncharacterized protein YqhQ
MTKEKPFFYGGQAVIEGVMMRGKRSLAVAVRHSDGHILVTEQAIPSIYKGNLRQVPFIRGVIVLIETMVLGIQALFYSAQAAASDQTQEEISPAMLWGTAIVSIVLGVGIFFVGPLLITNLLIYPHIPSSILANLIEGLMRLVIFIVYLRLITLMPDIRIVFAYHGAEHKAVNAFESGVPLDVQSVKAYPTAHTRCGTSFLLIVLVLAIFVFSLLGKPPLWLGIVSRIVLLPVIAAIGYELIRFAAARAGSSKFVKAVMMPGLALQSLTTREPDERQIEVALEALKRVISIDRGERQAEA